MSSSISQVALNAALASVDAIKERLASVSDELAANPGLIVLFCVFLCCVLKIEIINDIQFKFIQLIELGWEETKAHALLTDWLEELGFDVTKGFKGFFFFWSFQKNKI